jgi:hypothetical protein
MGRMKRYWILSMLVAACLLSTHAVNAEDELLVTGIVQASDVNAGTVIVDVKSDSCRGFRTFRGEDVSAFEGLKGSRISFFINSSVCKGDKVYSMHKVKLLTGRMP